MKQTTLNPHFLSVKLNLSFSVGFCSPPSDPAANEAHVLFVKQMRQMRGYDGDVTQ